MAHDHRTQPTEGDTGKAVIDSTGEEIGIVSAVEGGTIHVETDPGLTGNIKATLGWGDTEGTQSVEPVHVSEITDDAVHLGATDSTATDDNDAEYGEGPGTDTTATDDPTAETGTGTGHEDESTDRNDLPPEERRDDPIDGDLSGDKTAAEMDDAGDPTTEHTTGETGRDERGVPTGEDDPADDVGGMDGRDANERPPGAADSAGREDVRDEQLDEPHGTDDVQDPVPGEPRDAEGVRETDAELDPGNPEADPEDQPSSAEAATRGAEEDADLGREDDPDERSS
ncbi:MAG: DUF2171 domain-containing protein [Halalkalicoccus sp.]|nr:DUF2171 domain-containing protein [Halalkalicoccus sp.]